MVTDAATVWDIPGVSIQLVSLASRDIENPLLELASIEIELFPFNWFP